MRIPESALEIRMLRPTAVTLLRDHGASWTACECEGR